jgi:disulfide bond formation protein DsbB
MSSFARLLTDRSAAGASALVLAASLAILLLALAFEHIGGYRPCPLCLQQRYAYYLAIPASLAACGAATRGRLDLARLLLAAVAVAFLINAGLGVYHSGVEWKWWDGPQSCGALGPRFGSDADGLLGRLGKPVIRCDEAPWRLLGLSFAGWNVLISAALAALAGWAAWTGSPARGLRG